MGYPFCFDFLKRYSVLGVSLLFLASCSESDLSLKLRMAGKVQDSLNRGTQELFIKGPLENSNDPSLTGKDYIDNVPRDEVVLSGLLDVNAPVESAFLKVVESSESPRAPSFFEIAGSRVSWRNPDFQILMAFYHGEKAQRYLQDAVGSSALRWTKIQVNATEPGSPFQTGFDTSNTTVSFFKDPDSQNTYNPADESSAIYHEMGHAAMNLLRPNIVGMSLGENHDLDTIQEGLADWIAAAISGDDKILSYFSNNFKDLVSEQERTTNNQIRTPDNTLYFPRNYTGNINLDGRIISGALSDFRKYLSGVKIRYTNCGTGAQCEKGPRANPFSVEDAYKKVTRLALLTFRDLTPTSTIQDFAIKSVLKCQQSQDICTLDDVETLNTIMTRRGLQFSTDVPRDTISNTSNYQFGDYSRESDREFLVDLNLGFQAFPDELLANQNGVLDPCEVVQIFPKFKNNTKTNETSLVPALELRNFKLEIGGVTGFSSLVANGVNLDPLDAAQSQEKVWGWVAPDANTDSTSLITSDDSIWYKTSLGSPFSQKFSETFFPTPLGWLARAGSTAGQVHSAKFKLSFEAANTRSLYVITHDRDPLVEDDDYLKPNGQNYPSVALANPQTTNVTFCVEAN